MVQITIFSGHDGELRYDMGLYLTLFGGLDLTRPTVARLVLARRQAEREKRPIGRKPFFLTIFGGTEIKLPTLAEEFVDLWRMMESGLLTMKDWEGSMADTAGVERSVGSLTLFGAFDECSLPSENKEIDSLAVHRHLGNIPEPAGQVLQYGIGQPDGERRATVRRAVLAAA